MALDAARELAANKELDLILIVPNAKPPVCRIANFGKFKYAISKKEKDAKKLSKSNVSVLKEIKMTPKIEGHDYDFKVNHAKEFLKKGHKVKFSILFRGRELDHPELGYNLADKIVKDLEPLAKVENIPKLNNRLMVLVLVPLK